MKNKIIIVFIALLVLLFGRGPAAEAELHPNEILNDIKQLNQSSQVAAVDS